MSSPSLTISKAANLFVISIWYSFLTSSSFSFLRLNLSSSNFYAACLLTVNLSLTSATTRYWSISWSALLKPCTSSILKFHLLFINTLSIWLSVFPSGEVQVYLWMFWCRNIMLLTTRFSDVAQFTILTPLSCLFWWRLPFPIVGLKIFSPPTFALKSPNIIFKWYLRKWF